MPVRPVTSVPSVSSSPALVLCEVGGAPQPRHESHSPFCLKVHRALHVSGLPYARRFGAPRDFLHLNPRGQLPVLLVDDVPVFDSTEILKRLDALAPGRLRRDPEALLWEELADTGLNGFLVAARWADDANWARTKAAYFGKMPRLIYAVVPERLRRNTLRALHARDIWRGGAAACWQRFSELLDALNARAPAAGLWCGDAPSVADVALFGQLWSFLTPLTPAQGALVEQRARLLAYLERVDALTRGAARMDARAA